MAHPTIMGNPPKRKLHMKSYNKILEAFRDNNLIVEEKGNRASAQAPGHTHKDRSISIAYTEGRTLLYCHAGEETADVLDQLGLTQSDLFDEEGITYGYPDGRQVKRTPDKHFYQSGNREGTSLYRADRISEADTIYLVEGEQDVHTIEAAGGTATCNPGGAGKLHLVDLSPLHGKHVIVVRDKDEAGKGHTRQAINLLGGVAQVSIVHARLGKDFSDHYVRGGSLADLEPDSEFEKELLVAKISAALNQQEYDTYEDIVAKLYQAVDKPLTITDGLHTFGDALKDWWEWFEDDNTTVIETPWKALNTLLAGGIHPSRLYFIGGRPGDGKSLGLSNIAAKASKDGWKGILYSLEMDRIEIVSRILSAEGSADYGQVTRRDVDNENLTRLAKAADAHEHSGLLISDRAQLTLRMLRDEVGRVKRTQGLDFICIDYVQLMSGAGSNKQQDLENISKGLKAIAMEFKIAVVAAAQLNRDNTKDNREPTIADLRGSGSLEQDADVVILIHHEKTDEDEDTGMVTFLVGKNRTGVSGDVILPWRGENARIG